MMIGGGSSATCGKASSAGGDTSASATTSGVSVVVTVASLDGRPNIDQATTATTNAPPPSTAHSHGLGGDGGAEDATAPCAIATPRWVGSASSAGRTAARVAVRLRVAIASRIAFASGAVAISFSQATTNSSPVGKRWSGNFAISLSSSGCSQLTGAGNLGIGCVTCISAIV